jgi:NAD(P)-dependent dehydrogenase (short-subunit alcohol dehydrogenase family)
MNGSNQPVAVVTGATGGMGRVIALELAHRGMHIVTIARDPHRAIALQEQVATRTPGTLEVLTGDLSSRAGLLSAASIIRSRHEAVSILVNNAGAHYSERRLSVDGIEMHVAIDYVAAYGLTSLLEAQLRRGRARVVNVASDTLRDTRQLKVVGPRRPATLDLSRLDDLRDLNPAAGFVPFEAYARAKLLTVTAGYGFARLFGNEVTVNAVHPGIVATDIIDDLVPRVLRPLGGFIRRFMLTPEQGAAAALRLATDPDLDGMTGRYFVRSAEVRTPAVSYDREVQDRLLAASDRYLDEHGSEG